MTITVNLEFGELDVIIKEETVKVGEEAQKEVKKNTPELKGVLEENIELGPIEKIAAGYEIEVFTDLDKVPYAKIVEDGVKGRTYTYHKPKGTPFTEGVGAKMYEKTALMFERATGLF